MMLKLPSELEQQVNRLVEGGAYPSAEAVLADAVKALLHQQELRRIDDLLETSGIDEVRIEQLLTEAEEGGDYSEMTAQDWEDIERDALTTVNSRTLR